MNMKIARNTVIPYFRPGDIAYQLGDTLYFGNDSRIDVEKIIVFNPSFYDAEINLSVGNWSDNENFTLSWDGINFGKVFVFGNCLGNFRHTRSIQNRQSFFG